MRLEELDAEELIALYHRMTQTISINYDFGGFGDVQSNVVLLAIEKR